MPAAYSEEFRRPAVSLGDEGVPAARVAKDLGLAVKVGTRTLQVGESPARGLGPQGTAVSSRALDVAWLLEAPSYRKRLFAGIGYPALAAGFVLFGSTMVAGRLRRRRGGRFPVAGVR